VEFRGAGASPAVVDATGDMYGVTISQAQWVEWHNFDMANASNANVFVDGGYNNVVQGNRLRNAGNRGVLAAGDFTLAYNLVYGNSADGVFVYQDVANTRIYNNVLYGNGVGGVTIQNQGTPKAVIRNNITQANGQYAFSRALNSTVVDSHNCGQGAYNVAGAWARSGNVAGDPKFLDPASGNFALQLTSPCIDAGIDLDYNADFAGDPIRDVATTPNTGSPGAYSRRYVDMGAFEACGDCNSGGGCH
jgi:hypothetical protein